ncbi:MAG TPA: hypothetical protein VF482_18715 [Trebonia sp.]
MERILLSAGAGRMIAASPSSSRHLARFMLARVRSVRVGRFLLAGAALAGLCLATACTASPSPARAAPASTRHPAATRRPSASPVMRPTEKPAPVPHVVVSRVRTSDGSVVTVAVFRGAVRYVLHNGSQDPGYRAAGVVRAGAAVTGAERKHLLAAFNGGFKLSAGAGGYEQEGHVISPLLRGYASLIIDRSGHAWIAVWGAGAAAPGEAVYSVRQNLAPLVLHGRPTTAAQDWSLWGATLGGGEYVARSALAEDSAGDLIYAGSMSASPAGLAEALAMRGARIAMELDINPAWVQLDVASRPGGSLRAAVSGQIRPASQFLTGWTRDFITVLG